MFVACGHHVFTSVERMDLPSLYCQNMQKECGYHSIIPFQTLYEWVY